MDYYLGGGPVCIFVFFIYSLEPTFFFIALQRGNRDYFLVCSGMRSRDHIYG